MRPVFAFLLLASLASAASAASGLPAGVTELEVGGPLEISGVAWLGDGYAVVGDDEPDEGFTWPAGGRFPLPSGLDDPESLDALPLADGSTLWFFLGEDHARVADDRGGRLDLGPEFAEICGRGVEGVSARLGEAIEVAVVLEGGFFSSPCAQAEAWRKPKLARFTWTPGVGASAVRVVELDVVALDDGQRFRATDVAWKGEELWVLLGSGSPGSTKPYRHTWMQRFGDDGKPKGEPLKLEDRWGAYRDGRNWEALDATPWGFVLGFDTKKGRQFLVEMAWDAPSVEP